MAVFGPLSALHLFLFLLDFALWTAHTEMLTTALCKLSLPPLSTDQPLFPPHRKELTPDSCSSQSSGVGPARSCLCFSTHPSPTFVILQPRLSLLRPLTSVLSAGFLPSLPEFVEFHSRACLLVNISCWMLDHLRVLFVYSF